MPEGGVVKPGGPGPHQVNARLRETGAAVGIDFTGMTPRFPNTMKAHAVLAWALASAGPGVQNELQEVLFRHYFTDGRYPDIDNLVSAAEEVGLDGAEARTVLENGSFEEQVIAEARGASQAGVTGVPYFYINGRPAFSGAQPPEKFLRHFGRLS